MNAAQHSSLNVLWSVELGQPPAGSPLVAGDLVLVPTQGPDLSAHRATLHALSPADGSPRWQKAFEYALITGLATTHAPAPPDSHTPTLFLVALTSTDLLRGEGALVALDATGEEHWRWAPGGQRVSAPALVRSDDFSRSEEEATEVATTNLSAELVNEICVTVDARTFVVLDSVNGEERARVRLEASTSLSAPVVADDIAYIPCRGPHLLAVGLDRGKRWHFVAEGGSDAWLDKIPVVVGEHLFTVLSTGAALALRIKDGSQVWRADVGPAGKTLSPPVTDSEWLFVGARDGLHALDLADGREMWAFETPRQIAAAPVIASGVVYAACHDHHLYALDGASGKELWQYEVGRRIEVSPVLASCGEPSIPCILVADQGGNVTAVARPLSAAEYEAAGRWIEAASAYADLGQLAHAAELLEMHGEPLKAAELWKTAGKRTRAALQYEIASAWQQAAEMWAELGQMLKQAEALEAHARSLESTPCSDEVRAEAWAAAAQAFEAEGEIERAAACQREVARCQRQPIITLDVELDKGLMLNAWSRLRFIVRNEGFGPARNLVIRASGDEFEGQVMTTHRITTLRAGRKRTEWLDARPLEYGDSVPLRVRAKYLDHAGEPRSCDHTVHVPVARTEADRGVGGVVSVCRDDEALVKGASRRKYLVGLRQNLAAHFDRGELHTLCFDLGIDYDDLPGEGKTNKARELVAYLERRSRVSELVSICEQRRAHVAWREPPGKTEEIPSATQYCPDSQ